METHPVHEVADDPAEDPEAVITRFDTVLRILLTILFAVIWGLVETVLGFMVVFGLGWTLVTRQSPPPRLREIANRLVTYTYRIWRYVTQNEPEIPFPFSDFPEPLEPSADLGPDDAVELRELMGGVVEEVEEGIEAARTSRKHDE